MKYWSALWLVVLLWGCGTAGKSVDPAANPPMEAASAEANAEEPLQAPVAQDSIITYDTVRAGAWAPGYWAELKTVDYTAYDADMEADIRATAYMYVKAYHHERVLFRSRVIGSQGVYWGPCWLTAVADDGSLWILDCTENMVGVGAASPVATFCMDGRGRIQTNLAPPFDPYTQSARLQLDGSRLLHGGAVLDMKTRKWRNLEGSQGEGYCSDTINDHVLLVMGPSDRQGDVALFYTLPDLRLRLSFPCACHGSEASMDEEIFSPGFNSQGQYVLNGANDRQYRVDLSRWKVDSTGTR